MYQRWLLRAGPGDLSAVEALSGACIGNGAEAPIETEESNEIAFVYQSPAGDLTGSCGRFAPGALARLHAALHIRTLCFIHVFSGYRRPGDLQWNIESHQVQGALQIFCISVDYCLQADQGDLAGAHRIAWWEKQVLTGAVGRGSSVRDVERRATTP